MRLKALIAIIVAGGSMLGFRVAPTITGSPQVQISLWSGQHGPCSTTYDFVPSLTCPSGPGDAHIGSVFLSSSLYPKHQFFFEVGEVVSDQGTLCVRLFDVTISTAVAGSEMCETNPSPDTALPIRVRSQALTLVTSLDEYAVQAYGDSFYLGGFIWDARVIAR